MQPEERDAAYLWDMLDAARTVRDFSTDADLQHYLKDRKLQLAVERAVEIIGEAARRVSEDYQGKHPEIPWRSIIALRNVLAHEYGEIQQERMWRVVSQRIPELITLLERLDLPSSPSDPEPDV
jgi:uncharacterized protein with HEPN domain